MLVEIYYILLVEYIFCFVYFLSVHVALLFYTLMQDTVMLGADFYETDVEVAALLAEGRVPIGIGENTKIRYKLQLSLS